MRFRRCWIAIVASAVWFASGGDCLWAGVFEEQVAPILQKHCVRCHQSSTDRSGLSLATGPEVAASGAVEPGEPDSSLLLQVVSPHGDEPPRMPKESQPLSVDEIEKLRQWIAAGADWPKDYVIRVKAKADRSWWSLRPLADASPPELGAHTTAPKGWGANPIDRFILAQLQANGLRPNPRADRAALLRRVTYDLTGLPPTLAELAEFTNDPAPDAYERVVDRLLASPRYGEQWGRHWLDVVRFGESTGFEVNHLVDNAWPFRDYIIQSFNADKPFDRLVTEHLAGDAVGGGDPAVEVGLTFLVCGPTDIVGNSDPVKSLQIRADGVDEIIRATSEAFLGLTVGCARCHDHKFDPILQADYHRLYSTFAGVFHADRNVAPKALLAERAELEARKRALAEANAAADATPNPEIERQLAELDAQIAKLPEPPNLRVGRFEQPAAEQFVYVGGDVTRRGEPITPASLSTLADVTMPYELSGEAAEQTRRLMLARWLVSRDNPLTPRVLVNRLWHYHFGRGIVATPSDFGFMGEKPTHPELLDWLARQLLANGWRLKPLHKLIVMSETYQQSSAARDEAMQVDAGSQWLWRFPPRRLAAEELRDSILFVAGQLNEQSGGPGFKLYDYSRDNVATYKPRDQVGPETFRRAVYHQNARAARVDLLTDFDAPDCAYSVSRRVPTTTPLQALAMLNHPFLLQMADLLAARVAQTAGTQNMSEQVRVAFQLTLGRVPLAEEQIAAEALVAQHQLRALCRALLNCNEFLYVN